ncbi:MAG: helix-turn-helix domain-containing protein [Acidobacteria bacterium]|nr:helix-turn-helix domain-containing protein [Acidobacteriota bacterium]
MSAIPVREPITPTEQEMNLAEISSRVLAQYIKNKDARSIKIIDDSDSSEVVEIPNIAFRLLVDILVHISKGDAITIRPIHQELTTQEAADLLNVSRPFLVKLLEEGKMPFHKVGTHRRVLFKDLLEFKHKHQQEQDKNMDELVALAQEMDLGY